MNKKINKIHIKKKKQPKKNFYEAMMDLATRKYKDKPMGAFEGILA